MDKAGREALRRFLDHLWYDTVSAYLEAGAPFGDGRGLEIWIEYGQLTTVN